MGVFSLWKGLVVLVANSLFTYAFTLNQRKSPFMPWINFFVLMSWMLLNHMKAQLKSDFNVNVIDITGSQMVLVMKLSAFGWNIYDGAQPENQLSEFQKKRRITATPSLLSFMSYALFFPCILTGPSCDYAEFATWVDLSMFKEYTDPKKRSIPSSIKPAAKKLVEGILWIVLWVYIVNYINLDFAESKAFVTDLNFPYRAVYLYLLGFTFRLKYYGAWCIAEGACILAGLGFHGKDPKTGKYRWDRVRNIDPWAVETAQNAFVYIGNWNMNTNKWLKNYIYLRVTPRGKKPGLMATLATFLTSAVWHGTRPGYYLTFVTGAFLQNLGKALRRYVRPIFMNADGLTGGPHKMAYDIISWVTVQLIYGYTVQPFILLDVKPSLYIWSTVYFYGHWVILVLTVLFYGPPKRFVISTLKKYYPKPDKPLSSKEALSREAEKLRRINSELDDIVTLGVPLPDIDHMDEEVNEALKEIEALKEELSAKLSQKSSQEKTK